MGLHLEKVDHHLEMTGLHLGKVDLHLEMADHQTKDHHLEINDRHSFLETRNMEMVQVHLAQVMKKCFMVIDHFLNDLPWYLREDQTDKLRVYFHSLICPLCLLVEAQEVHQVDQMGQEHQLETVLALHLVDGLLMMDHHLIQISKKSIFLRRVSHRIWTMRVIMDTDLACLQCPMGLQ